MKAVFFVVMLSFLVFPNFSFAASSPSAPVSKSSSSPVSKATINLNKADANVLTHSFKGIGAKRAEAIVAYREANGAFKSIEDLGNVKGIGKKFVEKNIGELTKIYSLE